MIQQTAYPKIGIRPIIDGRLGGVRESLEETTMKMAQNVAVVYEKKLRYPDGMPVQCVVADQYIGGIHKANLCAKEFESTNVDGSGQQSKDGKPAMKPFSDIQQAEADACLQATSWHAANNGYFRGGGYSSKFVTKGGMPVTMCRLNLVRGIGPVLQIAEGETVELPADVHHILDERTNISWPTTWFVPKLTGKSAFTDVYSVMSHWGTNHGAISFGHIGHHLITLASMLRIPICMHNIEEQRIFRPSARNAFRADPEGADYRTCNNYGPLYN